MPTLPEPLPTELAAAHTMILAERAARLEAEADAARARAVQSGSEALIGHLKLEIEKLRRQLYGTRSERKARLLDQLELQLEELEATASEDVAASAAASQSTAVAPHRRKRPARKPFPEHLPRERVVIPAPENCPCCGSQKLSKLGEDVTETLEVIPRQWKVIQTVREKFSCRECEKIAQPPAPFHVTPRGFAGPNLLAMVLFEKFGQHQPLNRQSRRYAREGVDLSVSTLAEQVGICTGLLRPLHGLIEAHVLSAGRLHGDDTTVPILARGKAAKGRIWAYVRDDRPFGGTDPPAALYYASRDRRGEHPEGHLGNFTGILQADAYSGYNRLYDPERAPAPVTPALCWAHARRQFFELADVAANARRGAKTLVYLYDFGDGWEHKIKVHEGKVIVMRSNLRWCSDGLEFTCWNGEVVRVAFAIDAHDREIVAWTAVAGAGISGSMVRDMMLEAVEKRFATLRAPQPIEWLADNGSCYTAKETRDFAAALNLKPCFTPVASPESNGMSEAFVKTFKRDYVRINPVPDAKTALGLINGWFEDYNENHPHSGLKMRSPREFIRAQNQ